jgi:hypothetical protein
MWTLEEYPREYQERDREKEKKPLTRSRFTCHLVQVSAPICSHWSNKLAQAKIRYFQMPRFILKQVPVSKIVILTPLEILILMFPEELHPRQRKTWGKTPNAKNM